MYGVVIGTAAKDIPGGGLISTDNTRHATEAIKAGGVKKPWMPPDAAPYRDLTFDGYHRSGGRVGTANHWIVVPMVFCQNRT